MRRKDALFVEAIMCLSLLSLLLVRRKILRLYLADAVIIFIGYTVMSCVDRPKDRCRVLMTKVQMVRAHVEKGLWRYGERSGLDIIFTFFFDET